ncbi:MAG: class I SAM-dependent methyltransferase [Acidimicrobiia bacterium]
MSGSEPVNHDPAVSAVASQDDAERARSFGVVASHYERYRPGPPAEAVDWLVPAYVDRVVDLGAGTGALSRLLLERADEVVAVEPDDRMRSVLEAAVPAVRAIAGRGESIPLPDGCADAVLASSSWHWMDPIPTLNEVGRILAPGGTVGVVWSGPDPEGPFMAQARVLLAEQSRGGTEPAISERGPVDGELSSLIMGDALRPRFGFEIPAGVSFDQPEHKVFVWDVALNADELIGLLGTLSWIITMTEDQRDRVIAEARRLLGEVLGIAGDVTVDVAFRADAWRARRH